MLLQEYSVLLRRGHIGRRANILHRVIAQRACSRNQEQTQSNAGHPSVCSLEFSHSGFLPDWTSRWMEAGTGSPRALPAATSRRT